MEDRFVTVGLRMSKSDCPLKICRDAIALFLWNVDALKSRAVQIILKRIFSEENEHRHLHCAKGSIKHEQAVNGLLDLSVDETIWSNKFCLLIIIKKYDFKFNRMLQLNLLIIIQISKYVKRCILSSNVLFFNVGHSDPHSGIYSLQAFLNQ